MTYRSMMIELRAEPGNAARVGLALALAERFGAELIGVHVAPVPAAPVGYGESSAYIGPELIEAQREAGLALQERLRAELDRACTGARVPWRGLFLDEISGGSLARAARLVDLTLTGRQPAGGLDAFGAETVDQLVTGAAGPVLVLPEAGQAVLPPRHAVIAWHGSREATRALKDAIPLLQQAEATTLLTLGDEPAADAAVVVEFLARHEVVATPLHREPHGSTGGQLLAVAAELGADLLVMGAYGHSRLREMVFGGATREALREASLPVLLSA